MTPITLSDGRTITLCPGIVIGSAEQEVFGEGKVYPVSMPGAEIYVSESDAELIRTALFEAQRREIAVKVCAGRNVVDSSPSEIGLLVASAFNLADAILAEKGAKG